MNAATSAFLLAFSVASGVPADGAVLRNWFAPTETGTADLQLVAAWTDDDYYGSKLYMETTIWSRPSETTQGAKIVSASETSAAAFGENYVLSSPGEVADATTTRNLGTYFRHAWIDDPDGTAEWSKAELSVPGNSAFDFCLAFATDAFLVSNDGTWDPDAPSVCCYGWVGLRYSRGLLYVVDSAINLTPEQGIVVGTYSAVPEPSAAALALFGAAVLARRRKLRRQPRPDRRVRRREFARDVREQWRGKFRCVVCRSKRA